MCLSRIGLRLSADDGPKVDLRTMVVNYGSIALGISLKITTG